MGANPYCYVTDYDADVSRALHMLRQREFAAGRYDPALQAANPPTYTFQQRFPPDERFPSPGAQHASLEEAFQSGMETASGTGSILDIVGVSPTPEMLHASPSTRDALIAAFATAEPSRDQALGLTSSDMSNHEQIMKMMMFWEEIGRGECRYFVIYDNGAASALFFAGMSVD